MTLFKVNESVVCASAPWHHYQQIKGMSGIGPVVGEVVTVDYYIAGHDNYLNIKEYSDFSDATWILFDIDCFEPLINIDGLLK